MPKVLFCGLKNEYGKVERGVSYEFTNFYETLQRMNGVDVDSFFFDIELEKAGSRELTNVRLEEKVEGSKPDLVFCFLFTNQLLPETIRRISQKTKTFNWFADDHWRYPLYSKYWAEFFTAISTTDSLAFRLYKKQGIKNVIKTQWAANHFLFKPQTQSAYQKTWEISFLGQNFGVRGQYLDFLKKNNIPVTGVGRGWEENYNSVQEMLNVFSFSKISLNFTETSYVGVFSFLKSFIKFLLTVDPTGKWVGWKLDNNFQAMFGTQHRTIKGRTFQAPACGSMLLSGAMDDDISEYYEPDKEIVIFRNADEMLKKCKYYLNHEEERASIAKAGYERTIREHTFEKRFNEIFSKIL